MTQKDTTLNQNISDVKPGDTVRVCQIIKETTRSGKKAKKEEEKKEKVQIFEGLVLARKHGQEPGATITVRKIMGGIGVEKIFPIHSPIIKSIEIKKRGKVRRAKLYYLRTAKGKKARLKTIDFTPKVSKKKIEKIQDEKKPEGKKIKKIELIKNKKESSENNKAQVAERHTQ